MAIFSARSLSPYSTVSYDSHDQEEISSNSLLPIGPPSISPDEMPQFASQSSSVSGSGSNPAIVLSRHSLNRYGFRRAGKMLRIPNRNIFRLKNVINRAKFWKLFHSASKRVCHSRRKVSQGTSTVNFQDQSFRVLDLPVELILDIFDFCDFKSLHSLTASSRAISEIVFPAFVALSGLCLPSHHQFRPENKHFRQGVLNINTPEQALALCVWKRQLSFHSVTALNFMLDSSNKASALVSRALSFFNSPIPLPASFASIISVYIPSFEDVDFEAQRLLYGLQSSKCHELSVTGFKFTDIDSANEASPRPLMALSDTAFEGLEVFQTYGVFAFLPAMLPLTMHVLTSALRELELSFNDFTPGKWAYFLQNISFSCLESLTLSGSIPVVTLLKFLRRNSSLRHLSICWIDIPFRTPTLRKGFSLSFPHLEYIGAPALYLSEILRYIRKPSAVLCCLALRSDRVRQIPTTTVVAENFRRSSVKAVFDQAKRIRSIRRVEFHFSGPGRMEFCDTSQDSELPPEMLSSVRTLSFHKCILSGPPLSPEDLAETLNWIAIFPSLFSVELWESGSFDRSGWASALYARGILPIVQNTVNGNLNI